MIEPTAQQSGSGGAARDLAERTPDAFHETVIGARSVFEGTIRAEDPLRIQGRVEGEINSSSSVHIDPGATAEARINAAAVEIAGHLQGQVHATGRVELGPTSRVSGEVHAGTIVMSEGAVLDGALHMGAAHARVATDPGAAGAGA